MTSVPPLPPRERVSLLRRLWWVWLTLVWVLVGLAFAAQTVWLGGFTWNVAIAWAILDWGAWIPLAPAAVWLARRLIINVTSWRWTVPAHLVLSLLFAGAVESASVVALQLGWMPDPRPRPPTFTEMPASGTTAGERPEFRPRPGMLPPGFVPGEGGPPRGMLRMDRRRPFPVGTGRGRLALPIYFVIVVSTHAVAYHRRSIERERRALLAEARLADARAMALQTQLQPHFFFNALNTVASLIYTQPEQAEETICALGELMRGVLDASNRREIPLREELAFVDRYLIVQQIRFGPRLNIMREIPAELLDAAVPTLMLQPLVENAVVHGVAPFPTPGTVTLRARREGGHLVLQVANTCGPAESTDSSGTQDPLQFTPRVGLTNTRTRLEALYGSDCRLEHRRTPRGDVVAEIAIPWKTARA